MTSIARVGVMLMTYGSPATLDDVPAYLSNVRGGRPADEALIAEFRRRYDLIGGSPLLRITREQADDVIGHQPTDGPAGVDADHHPAVRVEHEARRLQVSRLVVDERTGHLGYSIGGDGVPDRERQAVLGDQLQDRIDAGLGSYRYRDVTGRLQSTHGSL